MPRRKTTHGGRRAGAGRPVGSTTTESDTTKRVVFRVGSEMRAALDARGATRGVSGDVEAKAIVTAALAHEAD